MFISQVSLSFEDNRSEQLFRKHYAHLHLITARVAYSLAFLFLLGDALVDLHLLNLDLTTGAQIRLFAATPIMALNVIVTFLPNIETHYEKLSVVTVTIATSLIVLALYLMDIEGGMGINSFVGTLNFFFIQSFIFLVIGLRFHLALMVGSIFFAVFLLALIGSNPNMNGPQIAYALFHFGTSIVLIGGLGYFKEWMVRKQFSTARQLAETLSRVLPERAIERVMSDRLPLEDAFNELSVIFVDIKGFTQLTRVLGSRHMVEILNRLFIAFDKSIDTHGIERVKTMGDGYMAVAGTDGEVDHAVKALSAARDMIAALEKDPSAAKHGLTMRVGIATGPAVGGVLGRTSLQYDYWGEVVNIAKRLESASAENAILVSEQTFWRLGVEAHEVVNVELKGVGLTKAYQLKK